MTALTLRAVTRTQGNNRALKTGEVTGRRFRFDFEEVPVLVQAFRRMVRGLEFDVCEMAFTTYLCAKAHGKPFTALPIFLVRGFHHGAIVRHRGSDVADPRDLEGREVGVNRGYTVTTGVWARGILHDEYGVDLRRVTWTTSGDEHVEEYAPPANVRPLPTGSDLAELVGRGDLPAAVGITAECDGVEPLIADATDAGFRSLRDNGLYPINHLVVVRDELLAAHPELASDLFWTFAKAKLGYVERLRRDDVVDPTPTDAMYRRVMDLTGEDPLPYGVNPNRAMIERLLRHAVDQRILTETPAVETLFAPDTLDLNA